MTGTSADPATTDATDDRVVFEHPLSERLRSFLRLDFLYSQALYHNENGSPLGSRAAVSSLLDILAITARGDIRGEVLKELERNIAHLQEFQNRQDIDTGRLRSITANLLRLRGDLAGTVQGWLQPLRDSEFLAAIKHRSAIPGGTCEFDLHEYNYWLTHNDDDRMATFAQWMGLLRPLCDAVAELLWLMRQNGRERQEVATGGVFNVNFERDTQIQLLRIALPADSAMYPEISGSHYRCNFRFMAWQSIEARARQADQDIAFSLICCS
jgi:cell division protein ZapD